MDEMNFSSELPCDGERFIPAKMKGAIVLEHWHRYIFAAQFVAGKEVLDIASGEGYGSARLASVARTVVGVDISPEAVMHARTSYKLDNLKYLVGKCEEIPLGDNSVDVVVSFETIEHFEDHRAMMAEIKRVLRPSGLLIISSPNKQEYSDAPGYSNPFHLKELYGHEFKEILEVNFSNIAVYGQRVLSASLIEGECANGSIDYFDVDSLDSSKSNYLTKPVYFIALASEESLPKPSVSILEKNFEALYEEISDFRNPGATKIIQSIASRNSVVLREALQSPWYIERNEDLAEAKVDPVEHWFNIGFSEGRIPSPELTRLMRDILDERLQGIKSDVGLLLEEIEELKRGKSADLRDLEMEIERTKLRSRYEIDAMARQMLQREEASGLQIRNLSREAETQQTLIRVAAQQDHDQLVQSHAEHVEHLRQEIVQRDIAFSKLEREAREQQRALEAVHIQMRLDAQSEVAAHLLALSEQTKESHNQMARLQQDALTRETLIQQRANDEIDQLNQRHEEKVELLRQEILTRDIALSKSEIERKDREYALESELAQVRLDAQKEIAMHLLALVEQERGASAKITQLQQDAEIQLALQRQEITQRDVEFKNWQQEALERQRALEADLAQVRLDAQRELALHHLALAERERAVNTQIEQLQRDLEFKEARLCQDLADAEKRRVEQENRLREEIEQREVAHNQLYRVEMECRQSLEDQLEGIKKTRSWRWTYPARKLFGWLGL